MAKKLKEKRSTIPSMPVCRFNGQACPDCGGQLVTNGELTWCIRRCSPTRRCRYMALNAILTYPVEGQYDADR